VLDLNNLADAICDLVFPPLLKLLGYRVKLVNALEESLISSDSELYLAKGSVSISIGR
jgi:hypothetical protein